MLAQLAHHHTCKMSMLQCYLSDADVCCRAWLPGSDDSDSDIRSDGSNSDGSGDSGDSDSNPDSDSDNSGEEGSGDEDYPVIRRALITEETRLKSTAAMPPLVPVCISMCVYIYTPISAYTAQYGFGTSELCPSLLYVHTYKHIYYIHT